MESNDLNLLQMPEVIMGHLFDKLDIPDILTLRKTCHHLRNLIADLHPDPKIVSTAIMVAPDSIEFKINHGEGDVLYPEGKLLSIKYGLVESAPDVCVVQWFRSDGCRETYFEDGGFISHFCRDFEFIFGGFSLFECFRKPRNPSTIKDFTLNLEYFPDDHQHWETVTSDLLSSLESTLMNRPRPLPVKEFYTTVFDKPHVFQILPCFQPKTLEKISITYSVETGWWILQGLSELEQWKMAKVLYCSGMKLYAEAQELKGFEEINIEQGVIEVEDILEMKEAILNSTSNLTTARIGFAARDGKQHFQETFGFPFTDTDQSGDARQSWFFEIPNKKLVLQISFCPFCLKFAVLESPPENARVIRE